MKMYL